MRQLSIASLFFLVLAYFSQAQAADTTKARSKEAKKACAAGDFRKGVEILAGLYVDTDDITHIYNQARCYEQNHLFSSAIDRFHEVLRKNPNQTASEKADVEKHIAECKAFLGEEQAKALSPPGASPPAPALAPAPSVSVPLASAPPEPVGVTAALPAPREASNGSGLRLTGIVLASVGVAALATGVLLNLKANSVSSNMGTTIGDYEARNSDRKAYETTAWTVYAAGAACAVTGAILYGLGLRAGGSSSTSVALLPAVGPGQAGALLTGGF
jgi:hypothetical protein